MYRIFYITAVKKDIKALPKNVEKSIQYDYLPKLSENPFCGKPLTGELRGYLSYSLTYQGTEYRIIYEIQKDRLIVLIIMIGSCENIYNRLRRRV